MRVQAQYLQPGDIIGSGETVVRVSAGAWTPAGKIELILRRKENGKHRHATWGKQTMIGVRHRPIDAKNGS